MTDDDKALVERLRTNQCADNMGCNPLAPYCQCAFMDDAADRIEALSKENDRLKANLAVEAKFVDKLSEENERLREAILQMKRMPNYIRKDDNRKEMLKIINAALGETK